MKSRSWEIVVAGLFLLFVAVFITNKNDSKTHDQYTLQEPPKPPMPPQIPNPSFTIDVDDFSDAQSMEEFKNLDSMADLDKLRKLSTLIPKETNDELKAEFDKVLAELEKEDIKIEFNFEEGLIRINKEYKVRKGEWSEISSGVYTFTEEFDATTLKNARLLTQSGSLIIQGKDTEKASISINASGQIDNTDYLDELIQSTIIVEKEALNIDLNLNQGIESPNIQLQTTLTVPINTNITGYTAGGHIEVDFISGKHNLHTLGGNIRLKDIDGVTTALTEGGRITLNDSEGTMTLESLGGHLIVDNFAGALVMKTTGGNIKATETRGQVSVISGGGPIFLQLNELNADVNIENGAGQIELHIPLNSSANLDITATKIDLHSGFSFSGDRKKQRLVGKIADGGPEVNIKTGYGTVLISQND